MPLFIPALIGGLVAGKKSEETKAKNKRSAAAKKGAATRKANAAQKNDKR